jgi:hypothetical protein
MLFTEINMAMFLSKIAITVQQVQSLSMDGPK